MNYPLINFIETGKKIQELRVAKKLKVRDIAEFMGFESVQAVYKWQRGESMPSVDNLYALSQLLGVSIDEIVQGSKENEECFSIPTF